MLHNKSLSTNNPWKFEDIEWKIDAAKSNTDIADVIARYREEIADVLKTEEAEDMQDENTLNNLIAKLKEKKALLETDLWKTPPCKIDLSDNIGITNFWKGIIDNSDPKLAWPVATSTEKTGINDRITEALGKIQFVHDDSKWDVEKIFKLFKWGSTEITDIAKTTSDPLIKQLLTEKDPTQIDNMIDKFIKSVKSSKWKTWGWNPFYISTTKLDEKGKDSERKVALRIVLYLYFIHRLANPVKWDKFKLTKALCTDINDKLDQLMNNEIPKIKWLHNTKVELWYLEPEYDTLKELNTKAWDIDQGTHNLWATALSFPINLTTEYESWVPITTNIDEYKLIENETKIKDAWGTIYKVYFLDWFWKTGDLFAKLASSTTPSVDYCIEVWWQKVKLWKLTLSNVSWNAQLKIDIDDEATIKAAFAAVWVSMPSWQLDFEIPVKWIKNVSNWLSWCKAALTKTVKFALSPAGAPVPPPPPPGPWGTFDVEASLSNVTEVSREEAERVAEEQLRERYANLPRYSPDRINLFLRRDYIKEKYVRKIMESEKWFSWKDRDVNATDRQQIQNSQEKIFDEEIETIDVKTKCPNTYTEIDNLCKSFTWTAPTFLSTMTEPQFQKKFTDIINADPPHDKPSIVEVIWKERALTYSSNILMRLNMFVNHQRMVNSINTYIAAWHTDAEINTYCRTEIKKYMDKYNDIPNFLTSLGTTLDNPNFVSTLKWSTGALTTIAVQTMNLKMNIIKKWSAAYKIKQKRWFIANTWDVIDSGFAKKRKKEMPLRLLETCWWARWIARTWAVVWAWILWGLVGWPLWTAFATGTTVWLRTLFSKYSHYTKEHEWQMKNEAIDRANYEAERSRLRTLVSGKSWFEMRWLWWKDRKDIRHRNRYVRTTHWRSENTLKLASDIKAIANRDAVLNSTERSQLENLVAEWFARLKYYKETWQNFLWSDDVNKAEEDYRYLYSKLIAWAKRLSRMDATNPNKVDETTIMWHANYVATMNSLKSWYDEARDRFKGKRATLWRWNAFVTWAVAWWLSYLTTKIWRKGKIWEWDEHNFQTPWDHLATDPMVHAEQGGWTNSLHDVFNTAMADPSNANATWYKLIVSPEVDSLPTWVNSSHNFTSLTSKISSITPPTDPDSAAAFSKAMTLRSNRENIPFYKRSPLEKALAYAKNHWADTGNQYLFWERFAETVSETLQARVDSGMTSVPIEKIVFWKGAANAAESVAWSAWNLAERSMNWVLIIKKPGLWAWVPISRNTFKRHEGKVKPTSTATP